MENNSLEEQCIDIAIIIAKKCWRRKWLRYFGTYEDVTQEAILAGLKSLKYYDPNRNNSNFKSYIGNCVYNHLIKQSIEGRIIRVPRTGRGKPEAEKAFHVCTLSDDYDYGIDCDKNVSQVEMIIHDILRKLSKKESSLLRQHYGIECKAKSFEELGIKEGVTKQAMRNREQKIFQKLR